MFLDAFAQGFDAAADLARVVRAEEFLEGRARVAGFCGDGGGGVGGGGGEWIVVEGSCGRSYGCSAGRCVEEGFGRFEEIEEFAERAADHGGEIEFHVLGHFLGGARFPVFEHWVGSWVDLFDVVVHVLDEEDVVIESLLIFGITGSSRCRYPVSAGQRRFFCDKF